MERLGIVDDLRERREAAVARISPTARNRAFPGLYPAPTQRQASIIKDPTAALRNEIAALKQELAQEKQRNGRLTVLLAELSRPLELRREPPMEDVMLEFCKAMNDSGRTIDGAPWSLVWLRTTRRIHPVSHPRQVCMWLVKQICTHASLAMLGLAFGGRDHTTIIYACERAPIIMDTDPGVRQVAISVLRSFGVEPVGLEGESRS